MSTSDATCCFRDCSALPIAGTHPYAFDVGTFSPPHRFWAHAPCLLERLVPALAERLNVTGRVSPEGGGTA
jgi:hypothetical protein